MFHHRHCFTRHLSTGRQVPFMKVGGASSIKTVYHWPPWMMQVIIHCEFLWDLTAQLSWVRDKLCLTTEADHLCIEVWCLLESDQTILAEAFQLSERDGQGRWVVKCTLDSRIPVQYSARDYVLSTTQTKFLHQTQPMCETRSTYFWPWLPSSAAALCMTWFGPIWHLVLWEVVVWLQWRWKTLFLFYMLCDARLNTVRQFGKVWWECTSRFHIQQDMTDRSCTCELDIRLRTENLLPAWSTYTHDQLHTGAYVVLQPTCSSYFHLHLCNSMLSIHCKFLPNITDRVIICMVDQ